MRAAVLPLTLSSGLGTLHPAVFGRDERETGGAM